METVDIEFGFIPSNRKMTKQELLELIRIVPMIGDEPKDNEE